MTTAPISREQQIKLMESAKERNEARARVWNNDPMIKRVLSEPAPGQEKSDYRHVPHRKIG